MKLDETIGYCWCPIVMKWSLWLQQWSLCDVTIVMSHIEINKAVSQWLLTFNLCVSVTWPLTCAFHIPCTHTPEIIDMHRGMCDKVFEQNEKSDYLHQATSYHETPPIRQYINNRNISFHGIAHYDNFQKKYPCDPIYLSRFYFDGLEQERHNSSAYFFLALTHRFHNLYPIQIQIPGVFLEFFFLRYVFCADWYWNSPTFHWFGISTFLWLLDIYPEIWIRTPWNLNQDTLKFESKCTTFCQEKAFQNKFSKMVAPLFRLQCVEILLA